MQGKPSWGWISLASLMLSIQCDSWEIWLGDKSVGVQYMYFISQLLFKHEQGLLPKSLFSIKVFVCIKHINTKPISINWGSCSKINPLRCSDNGRSRAIKGSKCIWYIVEGRYGSS